jgi:hypothetical protein
MTENTNDSIGFLNDITSQHSSITFADCNKIPFDIVCNGFSMKETIIDVLKCYEEITLKGNDIFDEIAEHIKEDFSKYLRIRQA